MFLGDSIKYTSFYLFLRMIMIDSIIYIIYEVTLTVGKDVLYCVNSIVCQLKRSQPYLVIITINLNGYRNSCINFL